MEFFGKEAPERPAHWTLLRDVGVLQVKLIIDGFRDLLLVPASLIAGLISLVNTQNGKPGSEFYELVSVGRQSERWINLFGAADRRGTLRAELGAQRQVRAAFATLDGGGRNGRRLQHQLVTVFDDA